MVALDIPADFAEHATLPVRTLAMRYHVAGSTVRSWRVKLGVKVPQGAPKGNGNAIRNQSRSKMTHGIDGPDEVRICLSCTAPSCRGQCLKVR